MIAVGQGKRADDGKLIALDVKAGDRILFGKYSGSEIKIDGDEYMIMREDEVWAFSRAAQKGQGLGLRFIRRSEYGSKTNCL